LQGLIDVLPLRYVPMYAVILAGSSGTRQHPLRANEDPISLRPTDDGRTLLRQIADLIGPLVDPMDVVAVTDRRFGERVRKELPEARILTEPMGRNTAASLALATVAVRRPVDEQMLVICADHEVEQPDAFREAMATAAVEVVTGAAGVERPLITFGIRPTYPDPEFSYIQPGYDDEVRVGRLRVYPVVGFEAKPEDGRTKELFEAGTNFWNSGVFVWQRGAIYDAIERYTPLFTLLEPAYRSELALRAAYDRLQPISIDEAILTGAARDGIVVTAPLDVGWRDLSGNGVDESA
jgi:mannose-1-phosphate guanylyltransferase